MTTTSVRKRDSFWSRTSKQLCASALSGQVEACFTYPTEYTKVMLQLDEKSGKEKRFRNSFDVIKQTFRNHGPLGVYRGFSVVFFGNIPKYMFRFGSYEQMKLWLAHSDGTLSSRNKLICGLGAGICEALFAVVLIDSIKVKFINDRCSPNPHYRGLIHGIGQIIREKGIRATYQGVMPTLLKQGSNQAIRFFVFESLKEWNAKQATNDTGSTTHYLPNQAVIPLFGAIAGSVSVMCNTPIDVVKTRMQGLESHRFSNSWACVTHMYRTEGFLAFYKGVGPRLTKVTMEVAIAFTMYDTFLNLFKL
ncbi:hypothetical protein RDWZM_009323 [Blomia tropicalis]|uniref:Citrate transport protein n=1 Tax=Blomia tropicalis TaxID=40697 RepID=A0A9Q0RKY6_BLOTA|nr:hypothetical protein RDWZM_009323 [Blomia tropicalis]